LGLQYASVIRRDHPLSPKSNDRGTLAIPSETSCKELLQNRRSLGVPQGELVRQLGVLSLIDHTNISKYELDKNEPPLAIVLAYARLVGILVEQITDDELELTI